jgi:hypothetical protein
MTKTDPNCDRRQILIPFDLRECISRSDAAKRAGVTAGAISGWCVKFGIGRRIGGHWKISKVALRMHLEGDREALGAYHVSNRTDPRVIAYFVREGLGTLVTSTCDVSDLGHSNRVELLTKY